MDPDSPAVAAPAPAAHDRAAVPVWAWVVATTVGLVLRWWDLAAPTLTADEQYTGVHARLPVGEIWSTIATDDVHPPLDYLLRHPVAGLHDTWWLRAPSALIATITLVVVLAWARRRGWFGLLTLAVVAVSPFFLLYGRTARMYALMILFGTLGVLLAEAWLRSPRRWHAPAAAALCLAALATDNGGWLLVGGLVLVAGLRRDADAWWWRGGMALAAAVWAAVWGTTLRDQLDSGQGTWIALTSLEGVALEVGRLVSLFWPALGALAIVAMGVGGWLLRRQDETLGRVWLALGLVPVAVVVLAGFRLHVLLARTLSISGFAAALSLAAIAEAARRRGGPAVLAAVALLAVLLLPSIPLLRDLGDPISEPLDLLAERVEPGDVVVTVPGGLGHIHTWTFDAPLRSDPATGIDDSAVHAYVADGATPTGTIWVMAATGQPWMPEGAEPCADWTPVTAGDFVVSCFRAG